VIKINPALPKAFGLRGTLYLFKDQYNLAIKDLTAAIKLDPNFAAAYYRRGLAYGLTTQFISALADLNRAIQLNPNDKEYYKTRAIIYRGLGKKSLAALDEQTSQDLSIQ
jgi:tetratricopeptide (TPR) repeat protein